MPHYKAEERETFTGDQRHQSPQINSPQTVFTSPTGTVELRLTPQVHQELIQESSSYFGCWQKQSVKQEQHLTYLEPQVNGEIVIQSDNPVIEAVKKQVETGSGFLRHFNEVTVQPDFVSRLKIEKPLTIVPMLEEHHVTSKSSQGPGPILGAVVTIGGSMLGGIGGVLASQLALSTMGNDLNPIKGVEQMLTRDGLKTAAINVASTYLMGGAPGSNASIGEIVKYSAKKAIVDTGLRVTIGGEDVEKALKDGAVNFVGNVVGQVGANHLTQMYIGNNPTLNFFSHEIAQIGLGAGLGALKGDALAGALGTFGARLVSNLTVGDAREIYDRVEENAQLQGISRDSQGYIDLINKELQFPMLWGKLGGIIATGLADRDICVGLDVATNTLENSFLSMMVDTIQQMAPVPQSYQTSLTPRFVEIEEVEEPTQPRTINEGHVPEEEQLSIDHQYGDEEVQDLTHLHLSDDTAEFREQMWRLNEDESRGRSKGRTTRHSRRHSFDADLQKTVRSIEMMGEYAQHQQQLSDDSGKPLHERVFAYAMSLAGTQDQAELTKVHQVTRFTKYAKDAVVDTVEGNPLHPDTKYGLLSSGSDLALTMAPSMAGFRGKAKMPSWGKTPKMDRQTSAKKTFAPQSSSSSSPIVKPMDVANSYVGQLQSQYLQVSTKGVNQNRQIVKIKTPANTNAIRMQKEGTEGGSGYSSSSSSVSVDVRSSVSSSSVNVGGGKGGASKPANTNKTSISSLDLARTEKYSFNSSIFDKKIQWTAPNGTQQTYKVYQRNDIDWNLVRTKGPEKYRGMTNEQAAKLGKAPQLSDGSLATLHHINQNGKGNLVEASTRYHGVGKPGQNIL